MNRLLIQRTAGGRPSKKSQKTASDGSIALHQPAPDASTTSTPALRSNFGSRRTQSIRDQKISQQPSVSHFNAQRSARLAPPEQHPSHASADQPPGYQFGSADEGTGQDSADNSGTLDFLPAVNFDDFHTSLTTDVSSLNPFPNPGDDSSTSLRSAPRPLDPDHKYETRVPLKSAGPPDMRSRIDRSGSFLRRHHSQTKPNTLPRDDSALMQTKDLPGANSPRKRQLPPPNANINILRSPRKSVGPGVMTQDFAFSLHSDLRAGNNSLDDPPSSTFSPTDGTVPTPRNQGGAFPAASAVRQSKTKSLHIPTGSTGEPFGSPFHTPDDTLSSLSGSRSPGRLHLQRTTTTPTSAKRQSVVPNSVHATGLAARTISPTDARRLKRMSVMPHPPPMPFTPPTPQPDTSPFVEQSAASPASIPRKSSTPTSSRTTPEQNRKSYSSGISNSSTTSYNSCLSTTGPVRTSQTFSTSRLPLLKTRHDPLPTDGEVVPPVPAIPKAYESPKTEVDQPFFSGRKSSLPNDSISLNSASTAAEGIPTPSTDSETSFLLRKSSLKKPRSGKAALQTENTFSNLNMNRKTLQPLRLPPMNLLPLSTPTAARIAALYDGPASQNPGSITPPPKAAPKGIPSTPMTASRASFFAKSQPIENPIPVPARLRSSSSHHAFRSEDSLQNGTESSSSTVTDHHDSSGRSAISPFISSSLPKANGHFGYLGQGSSATTNDLRPESRPLKLTGPRLQKGQWAFRADRTRAEQSSPIDTDTESFGTSLRRKLSFTRKRSSSKSQSRAGSEDEAPPKPPKYDNMPPPKLPASATWNGPFMPSASPTLKTNRTVARRKVSNPITPSIEPSRSRTWTVDGTPQTSTLTEYTPASAAPKRTTRSTLEGGAQPPNSMSLKDFLWEAKTIESQLDRDDQQAEDEMKKLASKRKDTENAAKQLDALRRRATAKERISHNHALRTANLNIFERGEIVDYSHVYFCGTNNAKKHVGDLNAEAINFGYDDERGDYNIVTGDHLAYRYEIIDILGKGSFGQVDPQKKHSMVQFTQSFYFRGHLCISTELLGMNLYEFIKCHEFRGFSLKLIRRFAKQLLSSLVLLKGHKIIHCDLKPENILLAHPARSEIKVIDFGSSCMETEKVYTYIQSRFYRSPEVILGMTYGMPIDMWSLGCILAELLTGYPIFPGENEQEQLACIMEVFGPPEKHLIEKSTRKKLFFDSLGKPRLTISSKGKRRRPSSKTIQQALKCEDEAFLDFISRCLRWDPDRRMKPDEAVQHEFITGTKPVAKPLPATTASRTLPQQATTRAHQQATATSNTNSPVKRIASAQAPSSQGSIRPLPDPPATAIKFSAANAASAIRTRDASSSSVSSPSKTTTSYVKRQSTVTGTSATGGSISSVKRAVHSNALGGGGGGAGGGGAQALGVGASGLPRVQTTGQMRSVSGKPDLAVAGAVASLILLPRPKFIDWDEAWGEESTSAFLRRGSFFANHTSMCKTVIDFSTSTGGSDDTEVRKAQMIKY
ncbi:MAG: hypothetical protein LQ344_001879 [Seirophora lacunosa]|nr:MAG: hypothetical protein LQ344_001879 [Seirophora lacunosa]